MIEPSVPPTPRSETLTLVAGPEYDTPGSPPSGPASQLRRPSALVVGVEYDVPSGHVMLYAAASADTLTLPALLVTIQWAPSGC
jgi:hypothetical protein